MHNEIIDHPSPIWNVYFLCAHILNTQSPSTTLNFHIVTIFTIWGKYEGSWSEGFSIVNNVMQPKSFDQSSQKTNDLNTYMNYE